MTDGLQGGAWIIPRARTPRKAVVSLQEWFHNPESNVIYWSVRWHKGTRGLSFRDPPPSTVDIHFLPYLIVCLTVFLSTSLRLFDRLSVCLCLPLFLYL